MFYWTTLFTLEYLMAVFPWRLSGHSPIARGGFAEHLPPLAIQLDSSCCTFEKLQEGLWIIHGDLVSVMWSQLEMWWPHQFLEYLPALGLFLLECIKELLLHMAWSRSTWCCVWWKMETDFSVSLGGEACLVASESSQIPVFGITLEIHKEQRTHQQMVCQ